MDLLDYLDPELMAYLQTWGYFLMFALMIFEWPIITFIAAFLASLGVFHLPLVFLLGFLWDILGDFLFYGFGYITGNHARAKKFLNSWMIGNLQILIREHLLRALIIIKFTPYLPPLGLSMVGAMHINIWRYLFTTLWLSFVWPILFGLSGYYIWTVNTLLPKTSLWLMIGIVVSLLSFAVIFFAYRMITRKLTKMPESEKKD